MTTKKTARNADATKKRPADEGIDPDVAGFIKMGLKGVKKLQKELGFVVSGDPHGDGVARVTRAIHTIRESLLGVRRQLVAEEMSRALDEGEHVEIPQPPEDPDLVIVHECQSCRGDVPGCPKHPRAVIDTMNYARSDEEPDDEPEAAPHVRPEREGKYDTECLDHSLVKAADELTLALETLTDDAAIVSVGRALGHVVTARRFAGFIPSWTREDGAS